MPAHAVSCITGGVAREVDNWDVDGVPSIGITCVVASTREGSADDEDISGTISCVGTGAVEGVQAACRRRIGVVGVANLGNVREVAGDEVLKSASCRNQI